MINVYVVNCIYCQVKWVLKITSDWLNFGSFLKAWVIFKSKVQQKLLFFFRNLFKYSDLLCLILVVIITQGNSITLEQLNLLLCYIPVSWVFCSFSWRPETPLGEGVPFLNWRKLLFWCILVSFFYQFLTLNCAVLLQVWWFDEKYSIARIH